MLWQIENNAEFSKQPNAFNHESKCFPESEHCTL